MRILGITIGSLIVCFILFLIVKMWGQSQPYAEYRHPYFSYQAELGKPILYLKPSPEKLEEALASSENLYLDVASSADGKLVIPKKVWTTSMKPIRYSQYDEVKNDVVLLSTVKGQIAAKKLIINLSENAQSGHVIFHEEIKKLGFEKGENFIVTSPFEPMSKALKEIAPTYLYGTTQPEILRILAMKSMHLIEAVTFRADVVIHPLKIRNQEFFDETMLAEIKRRNRRFIVGPVQQEDLEKAQSLNPFGIILEQK